MERVFIHPEPVKLALQRKLDFESNLTVMFRVDLAMKIFGIVENQVGGQLSAILSVLQDRLLGGQISQDGPADG